MSTNQHQTTISLYCKEDAHHYHVYHMVKAFFPQSEVIQIKGQQDQEQEGPLVTIHYPDGSAFSILAKDCEDTAVLGMGLSKDKQLVRRLYQQLSQKTGKTLPWGVLTGVRPTKLASARFAMGDGLDQVTAFMEDAYLLQHSKARLVGKVAAKEREVMALLDGQDGYALYVGIPFCPSICHYCSFGSGRLEDWIDRIDAYLLTLQKELSFYASYTKAHHKKLQTIYIGGGTPTSLTATQLDKLLSHIANEFDLLHLLEYTVEAGRPDSITREKLEVMYAHGVDRISINPQSMQQKTLDAIGRAHSVKQVEEVFYLARTVGFEHINMDLILGLEGETLSDVKDSLKQIKELGPESLTVHCLSTKRASVDGMLRKQTKGGQAEAFSHKDADDIKEVDHDVDVIDEMVKRASIAAAQMGLHPYYLYRQKSIAGNHENVGYAKPGKVGIYNILMIEECQEILAAGAGAISKYINHDVPVNEKGKRETIVRDANPKDIGMYIEQIDDILIKKRNKIEDCESTR